ncbi:hypothetical protein SOVF_165690 [Spinacia oleracea]|uniref:Uncharacterized protein n=1 Tax=Spinacia oleracea TaxID=3562 RepID=A0A9R0JAP3_SPIOL|nr:uncharacterized protein LOC110803147 [Spinacia oleracea]KNA08103.1 hypothetical protein SOVF_165690 [Spinacia oleracea]
MQNERPRQLSDPFDMFGDFGNFGDFGGSIFGRNPFDDPFFSRPFGSMFSSNNFLRGSPLVVPPNGPTIKELSSDDEEAEMEDNDEEGQRSARPVNQSYVDHPDDEEADMEDNDEESQRSTRPANEPYVEAEMEDNDDEGQRSTRPANEPYVDHPDDEADDNKEQYWTDHNRNGGTKAQSFKVHSCKVTYGGVDGVYYTSSATRKMGNDGVIMEDCKEADKRTGEATHRISRGLHDKGHSVTRKLNSDGKVGMLQTLHNLKEDELGSFEHAWKGNGGNHLPPRTGSSGSGVSLKTDWGGFLLPTTRHRDGGVRGSRPSNENVGDPSGSRTKKVIRIPID